MSRIIFDIETAGKDFNSLEPAVQDYLLKWADTEDEKKEVKDSLSFYPLTAEIVTIGMYNPDSNKGFVFFQNNADPLLPLEEEDMRYETGTEQEIIRKFWDTIKGYKQFITFNGRGFDCPFILVRSAVHKIRPARDLMPNRYGDTHIDLFDQLSFFGAIRRKFSPDMWCRTFGIKSPKSEGVTGLTLGPLFHEGKYREIARYCIGDVIATAELFRRWNQFLNIRD